MGTDGPALARPVVPYKREAFFEGDSLMINMGPQHPSTHGVLRLQLETDGEIVRSIRPVIGYLHRCFEKHAESLTYPQVIPYVDRMDYLAAMNNELAYALAVEKLLEQEVPERLEYLRVIMAELQRIGSHLIGLGTFALDIGNITPFMYCFRDRERVLDLFEWVSGARLLYNYLWIGGVMFDLPQGWVEQTRRFLDELEPHWDEFDTLLSRNKIFIERTAEVGILPPEVAISYGVTGPNLRGSGVQWDLRKDEPYGIYDRFDFDVPVGKGEHGTVGSALDRFLVRVEEVRQSVRILKQALDQLPPGDPNEKMPSKVRPPKGAEAYVRTESPRGELGFYVVSDGSDKAYRVKGRSPCFTAISVVPVIGPGSMIADAVVTVGSLDIVLGEIDR